DHRKAWVVEKLAELTTIFAIRICAYGILSNHFHLVVRIDSGQARAWSDREVVERYGRLFRHPAQSWGRLSAAQAADRVALWRARLADLSWFMRCLNESIARRANREDGCTGRFWEGRFRSQALLDEAGLLTCMSYVDLNPIRAGMAASLEESDFTSIQQRLLDLAGEPASTVTATAHGACERTTVRPELVRFAEPGRTPAEEALAVDFDSYVALLEATGNALRTGRPDSVLPEGSVRTLERVGIRSEHWIETIGTYRQRFFSMIGCVHRIELHCARTDRDLAKGTRWAARVFRNCA
ncbi:transposase, partial [Candidatus Binatia bacterium]|nr:transposase [Candidatus Binatia bacterium]